MSEMAAAATVEALAKASIASNYIIPPADLPRAFVVSNLAGSANHDNRRKK
jgi:hypothetical protein